MYTTFFFLPARNFRSLSALFHHHPYSDRINGHFKTYAYVCFIICVCTCICVKLFLFILALSFISCPPLYYHSLGTLSDNQGKSMYLSRTRLTVLCSMNMLELARQCWFTSSGCTFAHRCYNGR